MNGHSFFWSFPVLRLESSFWQLCMFKLGVPHRQSRLEGGFLQLLQPSPWQHHPLWFTISFQPLTDRKTWSVVDPVKKTNGQIRVKMRCTSCLILALMPVCIIWDCQLNQVEIVWPTLPYMKPFALLYSSDLMHEDTCIWTFTNLSNTYCMHMHTGSTTALALPPAGCNGWYLHSSLNKRVVPLERWIIANCLGIYHKAKAPCEKWALSHFQS